jgi:hypothetical protein
MTCDLCRGVGLVLEYVGDSNVVQVIDCPEPTCPHRSERPGVVLPAQRVRRLDLSDGDVLVLRMPPGEFANPDFMESLTADLRRLEERHDWSLTVLLVDHGWELDHADEYTMRRHGWVRA